MGAWGKDSFDNDEAADLLGALRDCDAHHMRDVVQDAIEELDEINYLDDADSAEALAAAELIAAARDGVLDDVPQEAHDYVRALAPQLTPNLLRITRGAMERIRDDPGTADLRAEPGWQQHLDVLIERLSAERT